MLALGVGLFVEGDEKLPQVKAVLLIYLVFGMVTASPAQVRRVENNHAAIQQSVAGVDSLLTLEQYDKAVEMAQKLHSSLKDNPYWANQMENRLAVALLRQGNPAQALPYLEHQIEVATDKALAHRNLGACLLTLGRKGRALSSYQRVVELEPQDPIFRLEYGQLLLDFRMNREALVELQIAARLCDDCLEVQPVLARYYFAVKKPALAVKPLRRVWQETENPVARRNLLKALLDSGQDEAAVVLLSEKTLTSLPLDEMQQLLAAEGRLGMADFSKALVGEPVSGAGDMAFSSLIIQSALIWGQASQNLLNEGYNTHALLAVDKAIALAPDNVVFRNNRVVILQRLKRYDEAHREWNTVLTLDPSLKGNQKP